MGFGLALLTSAGVVDVGSSAVRSARLITTRQLSGASGSVVVSAFSSSDGFYHVRLKNASLLPSVSWSQSSRRLSWAMNGLPDHSVTPQFTVYFFKNR